VTPFVLLHKDGKTQYSKVRKDEFTEFKGIIKNIQGLEKKWLATRESLQKVINFNLFPKCF
jgi:hypothetical protein